MNINDIFKDPVFDDNMNNGPTIKIHLRLQQRTKRKSLTLIENLIDKLDELHGDQSEEFLKRILKDFKKKLACNGSVLTAKNDAKIVQLQGDHRKDIRDYLVKYNISNNNDIIMHGF